MERTASWSNSSKVPSLTIERPWMADYQHAILNSLARITITEACTKSGKSLSHSWWNFEGGHEPITEGAECLWVAPSHQQAKMIFEDVARTVSKYGVYGINRSEQTITTPASGVLRYLTGEKPDLLYGRSNVQQIVIDEYTRCRPEVFDVCMSILTATGGPMKLIGNYIGNANWGHILKEKMRGDPQFETFTITAEDAVKAGIMKRERVDLARKTLHPAVFAALYMCEGSAHPLQMMYADAINDLWTNAAQKGEKWMTVDPAGDGQDRTVVALWDGYHIDHIYVEDKSTGPTLVATIDQMAKMEGVGRSHIIVDADGLGGMGVADYLRGCVRFHGGSAFIPQKGDDQLNFKNLRSQCYYLLADYVNDRSLSIDTDLSQHRVDLTLELESVRRGDDLAEGKLRIITKDEMKELIGRSPDFADTLMMRMLPELRGGSAAVAYLSRQGDKRITERRREALRSVFKPTTNDWR